MSGKATSNGQARPATSDEAEKLAVKYALHPGPVASKIDGDKHFIDARQLAWLYRVHPSECVVVPWNVTPGHERMHLLLLDRVDRMNLIHLYPKYDGDYTLPITSPIKA